MPESAEQLVQAVLRSSGFRAIGSVLLLIVLRLMSIQSTQVHRLCWIAVLMQGLVLVTFCVAVPVAEPPTPENVSVDHALLTSVLSDAIDVGAVFDEPQFAIAQLQVDDDSAYSVYEILFVVWVAGIVLMFAWHSYQYFHFLTSLPTHLKPRPNWQRQWDGICSQVTVTEPITLTMTHDAGPALCRTVSGYSLLLPMKHWSNLNVNQRELVLRHELAHYQHNDLWKALAFQMLATVHWFNPFAWLAVRRLAECAEWSCDAVVNESTSGNAPDYVRALLQFSTPSLRLPNVVPNAAGHSVVRRAERLLSPCFKEDPRMKKLTVTVIVAALAVTNGLTFELVAQEESAAAKTSEATDNKLGEGSKDSGDEKSAELAKRSGDAADEAVADAKEKAHPGGRHLELTVGAGGDLVLVDDLNSGSRLRASAISFTEVAGNSLLLAPAAAPSIHEAVIDVGYVFKHLPEFQRLKKSLQQKIETQDREIREEKQALQGLTGKLKQESLAPVRENIEDEIAGRHAKMQAEMAGVRRRLKTEEAKIYVAVYKKVRQAIADHAKENNIQIVRRATTSREQKKKLESGDPQAVMQAMNEQVLYIADDSIDITDAVLERLKKEDDSSDNVEN